MLLTIAWPTLAQRNLAIEKAGAGEKRVALVIGNAKYAQSPLRNPVNDARDVARSLRSLGFDVIEKTDVTQKEMNRAITQFGEKLSSQAIALFFYAGHGMQVRGKNYLIPIDAQIASEASVRSEAVDVDALLEQLGSSALNMVILDACRNNPFERRFRSAAGGLAQMDAPKGTLIAYATSPGKVASDGEGRNGLYTQELLKLIQTPGLPVEAVFKRVRANVAKATGDNQIPWEASSLTGDFYFRPISGGSTAQLPEPIPTLVPQENPLALELAFWESIKDSRSKDEFDAYLDKFPNGQFRQLALARVKALEQKPADALSVESANTGKMARLYLLRESSFIGSLGSPDLLLDGKPFGELANGTYLVMDIPAGKRVLSAVSSSYSFIRKTLDLTRGGTFYYRFSFDDYNNLISPLEEDDGKALLAQLPPGKMPAPQPTPDAIIYILRPSNFYGMGYRPDFYLGDLPMGELANGTFVTATVRPGKHSIVWKGTGYSYSKSIELAAGQTLYLRFSFDDPNWMSPLFEADGKKELDGLTPGRALAGSENVK